MPGAVADIGEMRSTLNGLGLGEVALQDLRLGDRRADPGRTPRG